MIWFQKLTSEDIRTFLLSTARSSCFIHLLIILWFSELLLWKGKCPSPRRWKWSHTCSMTSCATSARELAAAASSRRSSAPTSPVCSTTASTAGRPSIPAPGESFTSLWWRREATGLVTSPSAGTEQNHVGGERRAGSAGVANHCTNKCTFLLPVPFCSNFT